MKMMETFMDLSIKARDPKNQKFFRRIILDRDISNYIKAIRRSTSFSRVDLLDFAKIIFPYMSYIDAPMKIHDNDLYVKYTFKVLIDPVKEVILITVNSNDINVHVITRKNNDINSYSFNRYTLESNTNGITLPISEGIEADIVKLLREGIAKCISDIFDILLH